MRSFSIGALALAAGVALAACSKKTDDDKAKEPADDPAAKVDDKQPDEAKPGVIDEAKAKVDDVAAVLEDGEMLTPELYERMLLALESCKVNGADIDWECPAKNALQDARNRSQTLADLGGMSAALGRKLISHASPAVRIEAASLMASFFGTDASSQDVIVEAAAKETDVGVLQMMLRTVGNDGAKNPKVAQLLLASADHADAEVRNTAVAWIASPWNKEMPGQLDKLADKVANDTDAKVRATACRYGGDLGLEAFLPTLEKFTADSTTAPDVYGGCMEGLIKMWCSFPFFENKSEKAYKLLVKRLEATPRNENQPPWGMFGDVKYLGDATNENAVKWLDANKWFKREKFVDVLGEIIVDRSTNWMSRNDALEAAVAMGATKKDLEKLYKPYADLKPGDDYFKEYLEKAIEAAK